MAGMARLSELLKKNPSLASTKAAVPSLRSFGLFSATIAASSVGIASGGTPFTPFGLLQSMLPQVSYCDAGVVNGDFIPSDDYSPSGDLIPSYDYIPSAEATSDSTLKRGNFAYTTKEYNMELKPLFSAFQWQHLALTTIRSFLLFYLPLLEKYAKMEEDDDFLQDDADEDHDDLVDPFKKSVKQICRETTVVTTRRVLERLAVHYVSRRLAWKLLKDVPKSAARKAVRGMPTSTYIFCVSRTTFRGHFLGVLASWLVQVGVDVYKFFSTNFGSKEETAREDSEERLLVLVRKVYITTLRCGASLICASIGAGIGATLIRPSTGQWIGCIIGDLMGPQVLSLCFKHVLPADF